MIPINDVLFNLRITVIGRDLAEAAAIGLVNFGTGRTHEIQEAVITIANKLEGEWHVLENGNLVLGFVPGLRLREAEINLGVDAPDLIALSLSTEEKSDDINLFVPQLRFKNGGTEQIMKKKTGDGFFLPGLFCRWLRRIAFYEHHFGKD